MNQENFSSAPAELLGPDEEVVKMVNAWTVAEPGTRERREAGRVLESAVLDLISDEDFKSLSLILETPKMHLGVKEMAGTAIVQMIVGETLSDGAMIDLVENGKIARASQVRYAAIDKLIEKLKAGEITDQAMLERLVTVGTH